MRPRATTVALLLGALLLAAGAATAASDLWVHVRVQERGDETSVKVNLPLALFEKALPLIPEHHLGHHGRLLGDHHLTVADLKGLWEEIKKSPDMTFVTVEERDEKVRVWKEAGYLRVKVEEDGRQEVEVRVPEQVVDAFLTSEEGNWQAAVEALAAQGGGDLVTVDEGPDGDRVRVWIDDNPEAE